MCSSKNYLCVWGTMGIITVLISEGETCSCIAVMLFMSCLPLIVVFAVYRGDCLS